MSLRSLDFDLAYLIKGDVFERQNKEHLS